MSPRHKQATSRQHTHHHVVRDTPPISASPPMTAEDFDPILLNVPSSFATFTPSFISWAGGLAPYTLLVRLGSSSDTLREFTGINTTHFVWIPDVAPQTLVSLQIVDARTVVTFTEDPILVAAGSQVLGPISVSVSISPSSRSTSTSTFVPSVPSSTSTSTFVPSVPSSTAPTSPLPSSLPDVQVKPRGGTLSGRTIAVAVVGALVLLLFLTFPWWRSCVTLRRRNGRNADTEKQDTVDRGDDGGLGEAWNDVESARGTSTSITTGSQDTPSMYTSNPFEDPENVAYTEEIFVASPALDLDDTTPTRSPFNRTLPASPGSANDAGPRRPTRPKVIPRTRSPSVSTRFDSSYTQPLSETDAARLSISTSSTDTLPPSYRSRRSAGSIYVPSPSYPAFPPPLYTPTATDTDGPSGFLPAPPSTFRPPASRRAPRRRAPAPTPPKRDRVNTQVSQAEGTGAGVDEPSDPFADRPRDASDKSESDGEPDGRAIMVGGTDGLRAGETGTPIRTAETAGRTRTGTRAE